MDIPYFGEVIFRTVVSVNQLSIYGEEADQPVCRIRPSIDWNRETLCSNGRSASMVTSADLLNIQRPLLTNEQAQGNLLQNRKERVENLPDDVN